MGDGMGWFIFAVFVIGLLMGAFTARIEDWNERNQCARNHDVYKCKTIAVPIGEQNV